MKIRIDQKENIYFLLIIVFALAGLSGISFFPRLAVLMILLFCIIRGRQERHLFNPYYAFAFVPFSLLIYTNLSIRYMLDLNISTWFLAIINMVAFLAAFNITSSYRKYEKCIGGGKGKNLINNTLLLIIFGFAPFVYRIVTGTLMPLASVFTLFGTAAMICAIKTNKKSLVILVFIAYVLQSLVNVTKSGVLSMLLSILIGYEKYYEHNRRNNLKVIALAAIGIIVMILSFTFANQLRNTRTASETVFYYTRYGGVTWNRNNALFMPYMYLTTPWANLQYVVQTQNTRTYGLWFLKPILGYLQMDSLFRNQYNIRAYSTFNTFTFIATHFKDFGFLGSIIPSAFLGFFVKKVYSRYRVSRSPFDTACYVLCFQAVAEMFFSNHFFMQSYPFSIVIIMGIYKYLFCKQNEVELEDEALY